MADSLYHLSENEDKTEELLKNLRQAKDKEDSVYKKTICIDFDGVVAQYDGWKGVDVFGELMPHTKEALHELSLWGHRLVLYTTRLKTPALEEYLKKNKISYAFDAINDNSHNPPETSFKPIAEVYIDDRCWCTVGSKFSWIKAMRRLRRKVRPCNDSFLDDAAAWSNWVDRFIVFLKR
jgi:adenylylsulfate kinase